MDCKSVMASTFFHTCTIERDTITRDGLLSSVERVVVAEGVRCAVSGGNSSGAVSNGEYIPVEYTDTLYTMPDIDVRAGDTVIAQIFGDTVTFTAGEGRKYPDHRQTPLTRLERA